MLHYDALYKKPGMGTSRAAYAGRLLTCLKQFKKDIKKLTNLSKFVRNSYFTNIKDEIFKYAHKTPIYRTIPPVFGPTKYYLFLLYRFKKSYILRIEKYLVLLRNYIKSDAQKKNFKAISRALISPNLSEYRSHLFELFVLGEFVKHKILVEPFYQQNTKNYDAFIKINKFNRLVEITTLQESIHDLSKRDRIGVIDINLAMHQVVRRILSKFIRGHLPDILILALGDFASDIEARWGIDKLLARQKIPSHIFVTPTYLSLNGILYISPNGSLLTRKEIKFFEQLR